MKIPIFHLPSPRKVHLNLLSFSALLLIGLAVLALSQSGARAARGANPAEIAADNTISTIVGGGFGSSVPAKQAPMVLPTAVERDPLGRGVYIVDTVSGNVLLRFLNTSTSPVTLGGVRIEAGHIGLIAGGGTQDPVDGAPPREVSLGPISGLIAHPSGDAIFFGVLIGNGGAVFAVNVSSQPFTFPGRFGAIPPGGLGVIRSIGVANFKSLAINFSTGAFFIIGGNTVYRVNASGDAEPYAGGGNPADGGNGDGGSPTSAKLVGAAGLAFDSSGNLLILESGSARSASGAVRKVADGIISSIASELDFPVGITTAPNGNIFVALGNAQRILRIVSGGSSSPIAGDSSRLSCEPEVNPTCGDGGPALSAKLSIPGSVSDQLIQMSADANGLFFPDYRYPHVRYVNLSSGPITLAGTTIAPQGIDSLVGNGKTEPYDNVLAPYTQLKSPVGLAVDAQGNLYISDTLNKRLRFVNRGSTPVNLFAGTPSALTVPPGQIVTLNKNVGDPIDDDRISTAFFDSLQGLFVRANGVFIADAQNGVNFPAGSIPAKKSGLIRFLNTSSATVTFFPGSASPIQVPPGEVKILAGLRPGTGFNPTDIGDGGPGTRGIIYPADVALDTQGNIYIADYANNKIRKVDVNTGVISSVSTPALNKPTGITFDGTGRLLIADTYNNRILRQNTAGGADFTVIGDSTLNPPIQRPRDIAVDGTKIYVTSTGTNRVIQLDAPSNALGTTTVFAGTGASGFSGDGGPADQAQLMLPNPNISDFNQVTTGIAVLPGGGGVAFADVGNGRIRLVSLPTLVVSSSAASFTGTEVAPESIVAAFGTNLATGIATGGTIPLPTNLLGTTIKVKDSGGTERLAGEFFVSPAQANYVIPTGTALGPATVTIASGAGNVGSGTVQISTVAPGIFSANSTGQGLAAAFIIRVRGTQQFVEQIAQFNAATQSFDPIPVDLGPAGDQVFLILFGTGFRFRSGDLGVVVKVSGRTLQTLFSGAVQGFVGLDQINTSALPREIAGRGLVNIEVTVDGKPANTTTVFIK
jgi:uncharacterized protein (TIGR03437 family)